MSRPIQVISDGHLGGTCYGGDENTYQPEIWDYLLAKFDIKSVLDVGCGEGYNLIYFKNKGLKSLGVEGSKEVAKTNILKESFYLHDYTIGPLKTPEMFDLCLSTEFVEHVDEQYIPNFVETYKCAKYLFITHAIPGQCGYHHVNCRDDMYWINILSRWFDLDKETSNYIRGHSKAYYRDSGIFFKRNRNE